MPFVKGQSGNPGGRPATARKELNELLEVVFSPEKRKKVLNKLVEDAASGNHDARVLLLAYAYGKPVERQEIAGELSIVKGYTTEANPDDWDEPEPTPVE